jgi:hypothetical protein
MTAPTLLGLQHAGPQYVMGSRFTDFLPGLEDSNQRSRQRHQRSNSAGYRDKCRHVDVMPAGVHGSIAGGPGKACLFHDRQGIHLGPDCDGNPGSTDADDPDVSGQGFLVE